MSRFFAMMTRLLLVLVVGALAGFAAFVTTCIAGAIILPRSPSLLVLLVLLAAVLLGTTSAIWGGRWMWRKVGGDKIGSGDDVNTTSTPSVIAPIIVSVPSPNPPPDDPLAFERWVADKLTGEGYSVSLTPISGDYGVDAIAARGGERLAVQCKRYKGVVGVAAVYEVYAGARWYDCARARVVTTGRYTEQAQTLALKLGVELARV